MMTRSSTPAIAADVEAARPEGEAAAGAPPRAAGAFYGCGAGSQIKRRAHPMHALRLLVQHSLSR
jgi:hypothetical protein